MFNVFDKTCIPVQFRDGQCGCVGYREGKLAYWDVAFRTPPKGRIVVETDKDSFFKGGPCDIFLYRPKGQIRYDYTLASNLCNGVKITTSEGICLISPEERLISAFKTAQIVNAITLPITYSEGPSEVNLPMSSYSFDRLLLNVPPTEETLKLYWGGDEAHLILGDGKILFTERGHDIINTATSRLYILSAYAELEDGECMGIKIDQGCYTLLGAKIEDGIKLREIQSFPASPFLENIIEGRPPYFRIGQNNQFFGISQEGDYFETTIEHGDLVIPFAEWMDGGRIQPFERMEGADILRAYKDAHADIELTL